MNDIILFEDEYPNEAQILMNLCQSKNYRKLRQLNHYLHISEKSVLPGRNEPCYCMSGKKFKKCCMNNQQEI